MNQMKICSVCEGADCGQQLWSTKTDSNTEYRYDCPRCGSFILSVLKDGALTDLSSRQRAVLSHRLRRQQRDGRAPPSILQSDLPQADDPLPNPAEQADNLILWIGDRQLPPECAKIPGPEISAWIGAPITPKFPRLTLKWLLYQSDVRFLVEGAGVDQQEYLGLSLMGWKRYEALKHAQIDSRTAFMAMKFGDPQLDDLLERHFKPAVALTGFELRVLTDGQPAGLIDNQLRVALHRSRFVIADLTHYNDGAYWEAGFAEGLGRPVIYTCREMEWKERKTHFDTNHLNTIIWNPDDLGDAATRLTATIRATLPAEAKMTD